MRSRVIPVAVSLCLVLAFPALAQKSPTERAMHYADDSPAVSEPAEPLQPFTVDPGTIIGLNEGPDALAKWDPAGTVLDTLVVNNTFLAGAMIGVAVIAGEVWIGSTSCDFARVDLTSGTTVDGFASGMGGCEGLGDDGSGNLMLLQWPGMVFHYTTTGTLLNTIPLAGAAGLTGIDCDGTTIYTISWANDGNIYTYDLTGALTGTIVTGIPASSGSGLGYDPVTATWWVSLGFGSDEIRQIDASGATVRSFPSTFAWINGLDVGPGPVPVALQGFAAE